MAYGFLATPRYEVEVYIDQPLPSELTTLNLGRSAATGLSPYSPEQVFGYFSAGLNSDESLQRFFRDIYLPARGTGEIGPADEDRLLKQAKEVIDVRKPDAKGRNLWRLKVSASTSSEAFRWTTAYLDLVAKDTAGKLADDARTEIDLITRNTQRELEERRLVAAQTRKDRLVQISEALQVAQAAGISNPQITTARAPTQDSITPYIDGSQLFARGTKSLTAELEVLKTRESDDAFIAGLRDAESRLRLLKEIKLDPDAVRMFRIDGKVIEPVKPAAPKKTLILTLATVLGLMGGIMVCFVAEFVAKARGNATTS